MKVATDSADGLGGAGSSRSDSSASVSDSSNSIEAEISILDPLICGSTEWTVLTCVEDWDAS